MLQSGPRSLSHKRLKQCNGVESGSAFGVHGLSRGANVDTSTNINRGLDL